LLLECVEPGDFMSVTRIFAVTLFGLGLTACAGDPATGTGPKENTGTLVGALAGGLIGSQIGGGTGERVAAGVAGAALGGLIGNRIGASMDDEDRRRAYEAQMQALESGPAGAPVAWRNPNSGRYGSVVPGPAYDQGAMKCRQYTQTIYINGQPQAARGAACRNPDGTWTPVG
jgi:surface antigen